MKYFYKIGTYSHEDSRVFFLESEESLTGEELEERTIKAVADYVKINKEHLTEFHGGIEEIEISSFFDHNLGEYLKKYNLFITSIHAFAGFWGWNSLNYRDQLCSSKQDDKLIKAIKEALSEIKND